MKKGTTGVAVLVTPVAVCGCKVVILAHALRRWSREKTEVDMQTFIVLLHTPTLRVSSAEVSEKLKEGGFEVYDFADNAILARKESALTKDVTTAVGLTSDGGVPGIVFKLNRAYAGFTEAPLWEWLDMHAGGSE